MRKKRGLWAALTDGVSIPREALPGGFALALSGQRELTVRGCRRILHYSEEEICLRVGGTVLRILGRELFCASLCSGGVTVRGWISALCFAEDEK